MATLLTRPIMRELTEKELVEQAQAGSREAFAALYDLYQPAIYHYFYYRVDTPETAEELTSEVFVRMVRSLGSYHSQSQPFLAWLYTIARNLRYDHYRSRGRGTEAPLDESILADGPGPDETLDIRMKHDCLQAALRHLTNDQLAVILAKFIEGRSNEEVAALLDKPEGAIKSLQHRALATLRRIILKIGCYENAV